MVSSLQQQVLALQSDRGSAGDIDALGKGGGKDKKGGGKGGNGVGGGSGKGVGRGINGSCWWCGVFGHLDLCDSVLIVTRASETKSHTQDEHGRSNYKHFRSVKFVAQSDFTSQCNIPFGLKVAHTHSHQHEGARQDHKQQEP